MPFRSSHFRSSLSFTSPSPHSSTTLQNHLIFHLSISQSTIPTVFSQYYSTSCGISSLPNRGKVPCWTVLMKNRRHYSQFERVKSDKVPLYSCSSLLP